MGGGQTGYWHTEHIRQAAFTLTVTDVGADGGIELRLDGSVLLSVDEVSEAMRRAGRAAYRPPGS